MKKIKVVLLVLVAKVVCGNPLSETEREAAETTALKENLKRQLNDGDRRITTLYTSIFVRKIGEAGEVAERETYARNMEICEELGGMPLTVTSQRKFDLLTGTLGAVGLRAWRWLGTKRDPANGKWQWATGEDIEPSNFQWNKVNPEEETCLEVFDHTLNPWNCGDKTGVACEVERRRSPHNPPPETLFVNVFKTTFVLVHYPSKNHAEAEAACREIDDSGNGRLATPSSFRELEAIDGLLRLDSNFEYVERQDSGVWLGAERTNYGDPTWNTGFKIVGNLRQFVGDDGGRCLLYIADTAIAGGSGKFDWVNCDDTASYICQIDQDLGEHSTTG